MGLMYTKKRVWYAWTYICRCEFGVELWINENVIWPEPPTGFTITNINTNAGFPTITAQPLPVLFAG